MNKKTVIIGATPNTARYAYLAAEMLTEHKHDIVPVGIKTGEVFGSKILDIRQKPVIENVDTVTLYIGPQHQPEWYNYIFSLKPKRIIFNPGTENTIFETLAEEQGIEVLEACTLVMLRTGQY
ncbi:MAG TPA: CoA-binding protein [Chryseolinea sp.]|nr:CoA-binding protein [Chryseolinea sp.]HPM29455.1 CoA-binding protein [Chryseolinea sp.]